MKNLQMKQEAPGFLNVGVLTGVAVDDHVVLTAAHTFLYEPEDGHPIRLNDEPVEYEILADGWRGHRHKMNPKSKELPDLSLISHDYLLLRTDISFTNHALLVPLEFERLKEIRLATLVTREHGSLVPIAIPIKRFHVSSDGDHMFLEFKSSRSISKDRLRISGSPLVGEYKDGTLVLLGIASASGMLYYGDDSDMRIHENQILFTPAYRIPWDVLKD